MKAQTAVALKVSAKQDTDDRPKIQPKCS